MSNPQVSVIMPLYNTIAYVDDAVKSILNQTYRDFELIIVDNGSTDGSREYVSSLTDPRIKVITEAARGPGMATNAGIAISKGSYLAIMDADDRAHPDRLSVQVEFMRANPEVVLLGTRFSFLVDTALVPAPSQPRDHRQIKEALLNGQPVICNPSTMMKTEVVRSIGGHHNPGPGADFDFFLRMSEVGKLHNLGSVLHYYRLHGNSTSIVKISDTKREHAHALACAAARAQSNSEPTREEFAEQWARRSVFSRAKEYADCKALLLYRKGLVCRAEKRWLHSAAVLIPAALLSPVRTSWHLKRRLGIC